MLVALVTAESVAIVLLTVLVVGLLRSHGEVLRTLHKLGASLDPDLPAPQDLVLTPRQPATVAAPAAPVVGTTLDDEAVSLSPAGGRDTLIAFLSGGCETCLPIWEALQGAEHLDGLDVLVVTGGPERESESLLRRLAPPHLPVVMSTAAWEAYDVPGSPHFVYVDGGTGMVVGEGTAHSWEQVLSLAARANGDRALARRRAGATVPGDIDAELAAAGVVAGDSRLYRDPNPTS